MYEKNSIFFNNITLDNDNFFKHNGKPIYKHFSILIYLNGIYMRKTFYLKSFEVY